ncbi:hypothetical protein HYFRA_00001382 [Hymenoscyphus fraxineus]|uniref:Uncharacterized protein n=1 Tax=Hymenoscyphus fraxineus TaxID=746836 RepID=A0A9N9L5I8_9HELO|nr:hypothetical protein HYFRA_00001382 [Hymenoscyphus fraxineus]
MSTHGTKQALSKLSINNKPPQPPPVIPFWLAWPFKYADSDRWSAQLSSQETVTIYLGYKEEELPSSKNTPKEKFPGATYYTFATFPFIYFKNKENLDAINHNIPYDTKAIKLPWKGPADEELNDVLRVCKPLYVGLDRYLRETAKTLAIRIGNERKGLLKEEGKVLDKDIRTFLAKTSDCGKWNVQSIELVEG